MIAMGKLIVALLICCVLQACSTMRSGGAPEPSFDIASDLEKLAKEFETGSNISGFYGTPPDGRKDARNHFISGRLVQIDLRYLQFIKALTTDKQQLDSATDIVNMSLSLAGTLVGGVRAKANLAAAATGVGGTKSIIDKDYYYEKSIDALVATMNAKRKEVLVGIMTGLAAPIDQYPFERAVTDLQLYYLAGTLSGALQFIHSEAVQSETGSNKELKVLYKLAIPTPAQVSDLERLTDFIGAKDLTIDNAGKVLKILGIDDAQIPVTLDDQDGKPGARRKLTEKVREAAHLADGAARNAAIKKLVEAFKSTGTL